MVLEPAEFARVLPRAEEEVARIDADVPETVRLKAAVLDAEESRLANFLDFVGEGRGSNALAAGLIETESGGSRYCGPRWIRSGRRAIGCSPRLPPSGVPFDSGACRHRSSVRPKSQPRRSDDGSASRPTIADTSLSTVADSVLINHPFKEGRKVKGALIRAAPPAPS